MSEDTTPVGWIIWNIDGCVPVWTGRGSSKLYTSERAAKSAASNSAGKAGRGIWYEIRPVYF